MTKGKANILVPTYDGERFLEEFLNSLLKQDYRPIKIIIRDDKSEDNTFDLCKKWKNENESADFQIQLIDGNENLGLSQNIAEMAKYIDGEFVFLADQDDVWKENKVSLQVKYLVENPNCCICLCDRSVTNDKLDLFIESEYEHKNYSIKVMDFPEVVKHKYIYAANCMAIRNVSEDMFCIPKKIVCHDSFIAYVGAHFGTVDFLFEPLLLYRIHGSNISSNYCAENSKSYDECFEKYKKSLLRSAESMKNDGREILQFLKTRYGIDLKMYNSPFCNNSEINVDEVAKISAKKAQSEGRIGKWINN